MLESGSEGLQSIVDSLRLSLREVSISLNFSLDVLKLGFQLLLRLDALHQHDVVVAVHLHKLVVHGGQRHIFVLLGLITCHVFRDKFALGRRHFRLHDRVASGDKGGRSFSHF